MSTPTDAGLEEAIRTLRHAARMVADHIDEFGTVFGEDLDALDKAQSAVLGAEPAPSPASEPVAVNPAAAAFGKALSDLPALALAAGCFASPHPGPSMSTPTDAGLEALARFVPSYESWMDRHADDVALSFYRPATFGDLRAAWKAIAALVPAEPAPSPASEPVAVNPAAAAFGRALSDLPALALAAGCFVAIKVTELKK